ncbi:MtrB/PioB family decaheme-associated outer membrane protein [Uliginosibacterium sp. H3]|uniref:MtrB/PioB family decaheme-associated outer membrane protein n=1 Tax=Uliginosibacterium silvisoli TaxID=3114758 RepID=A0ABU6K554_9RHOO|nr:MtrB/PioB family decaheme-associated outer membrane protein [Uliginosibacterium sp. H3]
MHRTHSLRAHTLRLSLLTTALLGAFGGARADEALDELTKPASNVSIGWGYWSNDRPQQGIYDGMRSKGSYLLLDADVARRNEETGTWFTLRGTNLGLDNRELRGDYLRQGRYGGFLEYSKLPRDNPFSINTGLQGIGSTTVTTGTNLGSFPRSEVELGTEREGIRVGGFATLSPGWTAKLEFKNEDKKGTRQIGWGSAALFSVEPVDSNIQQLDATLQYAGEKLQLSGGYSGSAYQNHNPMLFEQLNRVSGGTNASFNAVTPISQPLDNQAHQVFVDGGYGFTSSTRGTFKAAYTLATQDQHIPSYDLGGANAPFVNAPSHLGGKVETTLLQTGLTSRPSSKLSLMANLRYYDVNDKTPLAGYVGSNTTGVATVYNTPQSYTTTSGKLEATYRLPLGFNITGGVDYSDQDRSVPLTGAVYVPYRESLNEITYRAQLRRAMAENLNGSFTYFHSDRSGGAFSRADGTAPYSNQINPIHLADRIRDKVRAQLDWDPLEMLSMQFRADFSHDDYPQGDRPYGPRDGSAQTYAVDMSYTFTDDWVLSAWYAYDLSKARSVGYRQASGGSADALRDANLQEKGDSLGATMRVKFSSKIESGFGVDWYSSTNSSSQDLTLLGTGSAYPTGTTGPLSDTRNKLLRLKFDTKYLIDKASDLTFGVVFEQWQTDDWAWNLADGSPFSYYSGTQACTGCTGAGYTGVVDGTTVTAKTKQASTFVGLRYNYKF